MQNFNFNDDAPSVASSRRSGGSRSRHHRAISRYDEDGYSVGSYEEHVYPSQSVAPPRRHTHHDIAVREPPRRPTANRSRSDPNIDMDLAYGDYHPSALDTIDRSPPSPPPRPDQQLQKIEDPELNGLVTRTQWLLEEADCLHHSATTTIAHLQKNPDAMAAVALTLAEISNLAAKMAPAALSMFKTAAPTVFGLLASPQFLIAAGVGLGATIVMFGGYKIIKQIQGNNNNNNSLEGPRAAPEEPENMDEMMEINTECLSHVEMWRRGVADAEANSMGTSVDGEFITPKAAAMSGIDVTTARMSRDPRFKFDDDASMASSRRSHRSRPSRREGRPESHAPSRAPTRAKSQHSSSRARSPSRVPSKAPTRAPSMPPSRAPSMSSSKAPSKAPSRAPTRAPSMAPSKAPSKAPSRSYSKHESRYSDRDSRVPEKPKRSSKLRLMFTP